MHSTHDLAMCLCDAKGVVGKHIYGLDEVHGGHDAVQRILKEERYQSMAWRKKFVSKSMA